MTGDRSPLPSELAVAELRALGTVLTRLPGEYRVVVGLPRSNSAAPST